VFFNDNYIHIQVGGETADVTRVRPYLEKMGKNIFHCGNVGSGEIAKICNNMVLGIYIYILSCLIFMLPIGSMKYKHAYLYS
jgi:3-hydroxyisobutyrate dehydrogenase-like beta-hydroxyacid dehydrogenase